MGKNIELTATDGHKFSAYVAEPSGKAKGALIVVMEIFGVNSHIKRVADEYAADGYLAIAPAFFDRVQRGLDIGYTPPDIEVGARHHAENEVRGRAEGRRSREAARGLGRARPASSATAGADRSRSRRRAT